MLYEERQFADSTIDLLKRRDSRLSNMPHKTPPIPESLGYHYGWSPTPTSTYLERIQRTLFGAEIQYKPPGNLHLLVLVIFELQTVRIFLCARNLCTVECGCFWVSGKNMFSNRELGKHGIHGWYGNQSRC